MFDSTPLSWVKQQQTGTQYKKTARWDGKADVNQAPFSRILYVFSKHEERLERRAPRHLSAMCLYQKRHLI